MDEINYEVESDGFALPDVPHMEIMMDALVDSAGQIDGTESFSLTSAQHYANGVLMSAGIVTARQVTGNEGVFSAIGDGFAAVWKYIKETFNSIWNFFFSRDSEKEAEGAKEDVKGNNEKLEKAENGTQSEEEANKQLGAIATALEEGGDAKLKEEVAEAKKGDLKAKRAAIKAALKELPKMNKKARTKLEGAVTAAVNAKRAFLKAAGAGPNGKERSETAHLQGNHEIVDLMGDMENEVNKFGRRELDYVKQLEGVLNINDPKAAIAFGKATQANIDQLKALSDFFKTKKTKVESVLKATEANLKKAKDNKDKEELKKEIAGLRALVSLGVRISKLIEANYNRLKAVHADLTKVFCL